MEGEIITKTSKILSKSEQAGKKQTGEDWVRTSFKFDGFTVSTFDQDLAKKFNVGDIVKVQMKQQGQYNNIVDMEKVESKLEIKTANEVKEPVDSNVWLEKDKRIVRQNCNQRAIELMELMIKCDYEHLQELIKSNGSILLVVTNLAKFFENIVYRDYTD